MKKLHLLKRTLLLLALIVGGMNYVWADADVTYDFTEDGWSVTEGKLTNGVVNFPGEGSDNFKMNSGYFMLGKSGAYINFPTYASAVEKIVVTGRSGASASTKMNIFVGSNAVSTETTGSTGVNTYEINSSYQAAGTQYTLKVTSAHNAQITKIEVYYATAGDVAAPSFSVTGGFYATPQSVTITTNEAGGTTYYTIDGSAPTNESTPYTSAILISTPTTLKAITYKGLEHSAVVSATYSILEDGVFDFVTAGGAGYDYESGVSTTSDGSHYETDSKTWTAGNVTMVTSRVSGSGYRWWSADGTLRFYNGSKATFSVPSGYVITSIVTTGANFDSASPSGLSGATWTGASNEVALSVTATRNIKTITVTYTTANQSITPAKTYTTLTSAYNLDFTGIEGLKAYIATSVSDNKVQMTQVNKVPAGTGLVLKATTPNSPVDVPVFDGTGAEDMTGNQMVGSATETTAIVENGGYILKEGVFQPATAGTLAAGKAYLAIAVSAHALELDFGNGNVTSINKVEAAKQNAGVYYNLAGQRVAQPTKGLYIVNGRKVIIK